MGPEHWFRDLAPWGRWPGELDDHTPLIRSDEEIYERLVADNDVFGFSASALLPFVEEIETFAARAVDQGEGEVWRLAAVAAVAAPDIHRSREMALALAKEYVRWGFGQMARHDSVGASLAVVSLAHFLWLAADSSMAEAVRLPRVYPPYGGPALRLLAEDYGWDLPPEDMATSEGGAVGPMLLGQACRPGCPKCARGLG